MKPASYLKDGPNFIVMNISEEASERLSLMDLEPGSDESGDDEPPAVILRESESSSPKVSLEGTSGANAIIATGPAPTVSY